MKKKSKLCSTGHDTGVIQRAPLGRILQSERDRLLEKQFLRAMRHPHTLPKKKVQRMILEWQKGNQITERPKGFNVQG